MSDATAEIRELPLIAELPHGLRLGAFFQARLCVENESIIIFDPVYEIFAEVSLPLNLAQFEEAKRQMMAARAWRANGGRMLGKDDFPSLPMGSMQ